MKLRAAPMLAVLLLASAIRSDGSPFPAAEIRRLQSHVYLEKSTQPAALLRADRVYTGLQRKAFFRIGVLPQPMADGVTVELYDLARCSEILKAVPEQLRRTGKGTALEMRQAVFVFGTPATNRLEAGRVICRPGNRWELLDGVVLVAGTTRLSAPTARLHVFGPEAGRLELATARGQSIHHLFGSLSTTNTVTHAAGSVSINRPGNDER